MQYRTNPKNGDKLSPLGFGCMWFHKDENEVEKRIRYAIEHGVNYFDTASDQTVKRLDESWPGSGGEAPNAYAW